MSNIIQSGGFLDSFLSKVAGALIKVAVPIAKYILDPLGIKTAASAINAGIQKKKKKKKRGSGTTTLIILNEKMNDVMKNNQVLEDCSILLNGITKKIENETK